MSIRIKASLEGIYIGDYKGDCYFEKGILKKNDRTRGTDIQ